MAATINWTEEAERWLKDIYSYIAQDNPQAAKRVVDSITAVRLIIQSIQYHDGVYMFQSVTMAWKYSPFFMIASSRWLGNTLKHQTISAAYTHTPLWAGSLHLPERLKSRAFAQKD